MNSFLVDGGKGGGGAAVFVTPLMQTVGELWRCLISECFQSALLFQWGKWRTFAGIACLVIAGGMPLAAFAQHPQPAHRATSDNRWQWASANQTVLRVIALDSARQQVVVKINGDDKLFILRRGDSVVPLALSLFAVSGDLVIFRPMAVPGGGEIDHISIIVRNESQTTVVAALTPPDRSINNGWRRAK